MVKQKVTTTGYRYTSQVTTSQICVTGKAIRPLSADHAGPIYDITECIT